MASTQATEAERMARVPGIVFVDGESGRRARVAGSGIEVFEVIDVAKGFDFERDRVAEWFDSLSPAQLDAALRYYELYPDEIEDWLTEAAAFRAWAEDKDPINPGRAEVWKEFVERFGLLT